jgi:hypothetical protein
VSTLVILVVVGLSIVAVTMAVVGDPDKPATEPLRNLGARLRPRLVAMAEALSPQTPAPDSGPPLSQRPAAPRPAGSGPRGLPPRPGVLYRPPRWWQRLRSIVLLVLISAIVGATVAAIVGAVLAGIALGIREAVN